MPAGLPGPSPRAGRRYAAVAAALLCAGCATMGPDYVPPDLPLPAGWRSATGPVDPGPGQALATWWQQLDDPLLADLIQQALAASPDLRAAQSRLREARARRLLAGAERLPSVNPSVSASRSRSSQETGGGNSRTLFSAGFDASWEPDLFGGLARGVEAAQADQEQAQAKLDQTRVTLAAEVALNYVDLRAYQARLAIARDNLASQAETLQISDWRAQAGLTTILDVEQARTDLEQTRSQIPSLEAGLAEARHRLAILLGQPPGTLDDRLADTGPIPVVPAHLAIGIPADTLRQRPDLRAAERALAAETARLGVAQANRRPDLTLSGSLGLESLTLGELGSPQALAGSLAARLAGTLWDGDRLKQRVAIQDAVREQALIAYEASVLTALEEVENALVALEAGRRRQATLVEASRAAARAAELARQQYQAGLVDFQNVLSTQRALLATQDSLAAAQADAVTALIRLYKALGGGWTSPPLP